MRGRREEEDEDEANKEGEDKADKEDEDETEKETKEENLQGLKILDQAVQWHKQSAYLFLHWGNRPIKRPGKFWIDFIYRQCGKRISIGVWRKIVETHSSKVNTREEQEKLSEALLHQHSTGQRYYCCEDVDEVSDTMMNTWTNQVQRVTAPTLPISHIIPPPIQTNTQRQLTPMQHNYIPHVGDWQCKNCGNMNFARREECRRCARKKVE